MYRQRLQALFRLAHFPVADYGNDHFVITPQIVGQLRTEAYFDQWKMALDQGWYHVRLEDHSLLVFNDSGASPSYSYLQCPIELESMRDYLNGTGRDFNARNAREAREEYEQLWETSKLRGNLTPIRYDLDPPGYLAGSHPLGHIHIGLGNNVRIGVRRVLSPVAFTLFVMRQMYPPSWRRLLEHSDHCGLPNLCRRNLPLVDDDHWQMQDEIELHLV